MSTIFDIFEIIELSNRGIAAVIAESTKLEVGKTLKVELVKPNGETLGATANKEYMLRTNPTPMEYEAFILKNVIKRDIPPGSRLRLKV